MEEKKSIQKENTEKEKPFDLYCEEEQLKMRDGFIEVVNKSNLPLSVKRLIVIGLVNDLTRSFDAAIDKQKEAFYNE